jgi:hypothetical protein
MRARKKYIVVEGKSLKDGFVYLLRVWDNDGAGERDSRACCAAYARRAPDEGGAVRRYRTDEWPEGCERADD